MEEIIISRVRGCSGRPCSGARWKRGVGWVKKFENLLELTQFVRKEGAIVLSVVDWEKFVTDDNINEYWKFAGGAQLKLDIYNTYME